MAEHHGGSQNRQDDRDVVLSQGQLRTLLDEASEEGADKALKKIGLENGEARQDINELRGLAGAVRQIRSTALNVVTKAVTLAIIGILLAWIGARVKVGQVLKPFTGS